MDADRNKHKIISDAAGKQPAHRRDDGAGKGRLRIVHDATPGLNPAEACVECQTYPDTDTAARSDWSALMAQAQDGDGDAYRRLLTEIAPYLRSLAANRLANPSVVEDAVQDVLLAIHRLRHTYDPRRPFGPWLVTIAGRRFIDRYRHEARRRARETPLEPVHETFAADRANPHDETADHQVLRKAVDSLPPAQREAIWLLKLNEMSLREASLSSGKSVSALKVATHRALRSLTRTFARMNE